jgi:SAM-dependent methyltransferase
VTASGRRTTGAGTRAAAGSSEGWHGWDDYAAFYDWENRRTVGRRDVAFWQAFAHEAGGLVLELGAGTGRVTLPLARAGAHVVGVDRSAEMLAFARKRVRRARRLTGRALLARGDIRDLPFETGTFAGVIAPYGILQSLLRDRDLTRALGSVARILAPGARFGMELVPDVPRWREYRRRVTLVGRFGRTGPPVTLVESVRQDRARGLTIFDHEYTVGWGRRREVREFTIKFRTLPVAALLRRLARAGFTVDRMSGGYAGEPFSDEADAWIVTAVRNEGVPRAESRGCT